MNFPKLKTPFVLSFMSDDESKKELMEILNECSKKVSEEYVPGMSSFQIIEGVLSDTECPTPDSKYNQCLLEITTRAGNITNLTLEGEKISDDILRLEILIRKQEKKMLEVEDEDDKELIRIKIRNLEREILKNNVKINNIKVDLFRAVRESKIYLDMMEELKDKLQCEPREFVFNYNINKEKYTKKIENINKEKMEQIKNDMILQYNAQEEIMNKIKARQNLLRKM